MDTFFDNEVEQEISKKINDLVFTYEVNHIIFRSSSYDQKNTRYSEIEGNFENDRNFRIRVDHAYPINEFIIAEGIKLANWRNYEGLKEFWLKAKGTFFSEIDEMASRGENKYALNSYFHSLFAMIDRKISISNLESWVAEMDPANNRERMQLGIGNEFKAHFMVEYNLDTVLPLIRSELAFRYAILNDIKFELVKVYCKNLLIPTINVLPKTPFIGNNKTDMYEVIVVLERYADFKDFEILKSVLLKMLGLEEKKYSDFRSEILKRKTKFRFLKSVLIDSKDISIND